MRARGKDCASARIWSLSWCPCVELKQAINGLDIQIVRKQQWSRSAPAVCWLLRQVWEASVQCCVVRAAGTGLAGAGIQPVSQLASCEQHGACNNCCSQPRTLYAAHQGRTLQLLHVMARVSPPYHAMHVVFSAAAARVTTAMENICGNRFNISIFCTKNECTLLLLGKTSKIACHWRR